MNEELKEIYEKIQDYMSEEEFLNEIKKRKEEEENKKEDEKISFMENSDINIANLIMGEYINEKNKSASGEKKLKFEDLEGGQENITVTGKVMSIANPKSFKTRKGAKGKLCNIILADDTKELKCVFWTENMSNLEKFKEGDVIQITGVRVTKNDYTKKEELQLAPRSEVIVENPDDYPEFPEYKEIITDIADISFDEDSTNNTVNIIGRVYRKSSINTFKRENQDDGQVAHITLQDESGKIDYTLWNKDVELLNDFDVEDTVKILNASVRLDKNDNTNLVHQNSKIEKGEYDVPEFEENFIKIGDVEEISDVSVMGVVSKIQDVITFKREDETEGYVRSIDILDDTGSIRVTLWNNNALNLDIKKRDILEIIGGNIEYDEYSPTNYRVNTNFKTNFTINPTEPEELINILDELKVNIGPVKIEQVQEADEDGIEFDIIGRVLNIGNKREFQRDDDSLGTVKTVDFADETGLIRLSLWDEKANYTELEIGKAYSIENARSKLGMSDVELNIGKTSRIIELDDEQSKYVSSIETLEELIYNKISIDELEEDKLDEDDINLKVIARILNIRPINTFERGDGNMGSVQNIEIADNTGSIRLVIWNPNEDKELTIGDPIKIMNPRLNFNGDSNELSINNGSNLLEPSESEIELLPSIEEIQEAIYVEKTLNEIEVDDTNIRVSGHLSNLNANNILLSKCPNCNSRLEKDEDGYYCNYCGEVITEPRYTLMLPARISDDTDEIQITFFGSLVEKLLNMKENEIINLILENGDVGPLEGKIENLEGEFIEIIADVNYNDFEEDKRLRPKEILEHHA